MNTFLEFMIDKNISQITLIMILMLPVIATIISAARQIIGIKGFGIYTPLIITFAFLALGLEFGLILFVTIILSGTLARFSVRKLRLLYLPRMAIVITCVAMAVLFVFYLSAYFNQTKAIPLTVFSLLIMITMVEKFIAAQIERGTKPAIILTIETLILSVVCYYVADWKQFQIFVLKQPELIILSSLLANILLGRWTGLRLSEYLRFKETIKYVELPKKK